VRVDLVFRPKDLQEQTYDVAVVVDVLRATSVMTTLVAAGAPQVLLARNVAHALYLRQQLGDGWYLSGARRGKKVDGFDFANGMCEFSSMELGKHRFILSTTNGTATIYRTRDYANLVFVGALLNATATARASLEVLSKCDGRGLIVLSGIEGQYALDDGLTGGVILERMLAMEPNLELGDEARTCLLMARGACCLEKEIRQSITGRALERVGLVCEIAFVTEIDRFDLAVAVVEDGPTDTLGLSRY